MINILQKSVCPDNSPSVILAIPDISSPFYAMISIPDTEILPLTSTSHPGQWPSCLFSTLDNSHSVFYPPLTIPLLSFPPSRTIPLPSVHCTCIICIMMSVKINDAVMHVGNCPWFKNNNPYPWFITKSYILQFECL